MALILLASSLAIYALALGPIASFITCMFFNSMRTLQLLAMDFRLERLSRKGGRSYILTDSSKLTLVSDVRGGRSAFKSRHTPSIAHFCRVGIKFRNDFI